jgi:phosphonate transport system substrate-binding protein
MQLHHFTHRLAAARTLGAWAVLLATSLTLLLQACSKEAPPGAIQYANKPVAVDSRTHYVFLVHPLFNPQLLHQKFEPLMAYLDSQIPGTAFDLETANDYADFEGKLRARQAAFALPNPYHATLAQDWGYHVIAKMGDDSLFKGIFIVRKDSRIKVPADLKGKSVAYPAATALAAAMMPQLYLQKHGVDVQNDITNMYVGTHNSSIMNAYLKQSAASATWPTAWKAFQQASPTEAAQLRVIWETPTLIQNAIITRNDVPAAVNTQVAQLLTGLQHSEVGRGLLAGIDTREFVSANDQDFEVVRRFLKEYNSAVKKQP